MSISFITSKIDQARHIVKHRSCGSLSQIIKCIECHFLTNCDFLNEFQITHVIDDAKSYMKEYDREQKLKRILK